VRKIRKWAEQGENFGSMKNPSLRLGEVVSMAPSQVMFVKGKHVVGIPRGRFFNDIYPSKICFSRANKFGVASGKSENAYCSISNQTTSL
jgi:hypothetical protein